MQHAIATPNASPRVRPPEPAHEQDARTTIRTTPATWPRARRVSEREHRDPSTSTGATPRATG